MTRGRPKTPRAAGAAFLETESVTQRVADESRNNSTGQGKRALTPRVFWARAVAGATALIRERAAQRLEARSRAVTAERKREWRASGKVAREAGTERATHAPPNGSRWHLRRAQNKRELFDRVERCGKADGHQVTLSCRGGCGNNVTIDVGCGSHWFCPRCRQRTAQRFRVDFEAERLGILTAAARAGLTRRAQRKGERWGERFVTLTLPHEGTPTERIRTLKATWARFWRVLNDDLREHLQGPSGITIEDVPRGFPQRVDGDELKLADLLSYVRVLEWTPGADGLGHPHFHVWLFSRFIDRAVLKRLWEDAYEHVTGRRQELILWVEAVRDDIAHELVKYLTKDWDVTPDGAKRARPEVFAEVYGELADTRLRQSSSGFSMWRVARYRVCPCCGFERERGHWARVSVTHSLDSHLAPIGVLLAPGEGMPERLAGAGERDRELRQIWEAKREREYLESPELRILVRRLRLILPQ